MIDRFIEKNMFKDNRKENFRKNIIENESVKEISENKELFNYDISKMDEKYLYIDFENSKIPQKIEKTARIGIPNKGVWTKRKLRFFVAGNKFVSGMRKSEFLEDIWK